MKSGWRAAWAFLFVVGLWGCPAPEPATEVLVIVRSDLSVPTAIDALRIRVLDEQGKVERRKQELDLTALPASSKDSPFPFSFSLSSPDGLATAFRLVVTGTQGKARMDVVEAQAKGQFAPGRRMVMRVDLLSSCAQMLCREGPALSDRACVRGQCVPVPAADLVPDDGQVIDLDPATGSDAGAKADGSTRDEGGSSDVDGGSSGRDSGPVAPIGDAGSERCDVDATCAALAEGASPEGCAVGVCMDGRCVLRADDADKDGHAAATCTVPGGEVQRGDDCDDAAPERHPGAWDGPEADGKADACNQRDDDCDGKVDEEMAAGKSCTCDPVRDTAVPCAERPDGTAIEWPMGAPLGNCKLGKRSCVNGAFTACMGAVEPAAMDSCAPGDDADCDGEVNEGCACANGETQPCGSAVGDCEQGMQACQNGKWSACMGAIGPRGADTCDPGSDRDCDGMPNEGCECVSGTQEPCGEAIGARGDCAAMMATCVNGRWRRQDCQPRSEELCNGDNRDENCNGVVNERRQCQCTNGDRQTCLLALLQFGPCALGFTRCVDGSWEGCSIPPQMRDRCVPSDAFGAGDENCNGRRHEGCACISGETRTCSRGNCTGGTQTCDRNGEWRECECSEPDAGGPTDPDPVPDPDPDPGMPSTLIL